MSLTTQTPRSKMSFIGADELVTDDEWVVANALINDSNRSRRTCQNKNSISKRGMEDSKKELDFTFNPNTPVGNG